ncbi:beta-ketoacyl-ACP synthase III [Shewanella pneumatophori]|uniref:Beta-ketoacyl-ACP synthase III n=1 Tax=Shewanella pneumatophori TaxID=314092 RepID=A0A9X1Z8J1_9GAMM|nr:beta-ketoacyl-ACP synthase III [Shewanella pneumatophori]MCL1137514.1 beta-ketoacyl-ACP synthase III [Shewanella pneumatophori]
MSVYINSTGHFLPGPAINNDEIETILGLVNGKKSRLKRKILQSNGIKTRHYAINQQQETQISNSEMAANAGKSCLGNSYISPNQVEMLSVATSQGDLVLPGFGSMIQAELDISSVELQTSHGICSSSMMALKAAYTNIKAQETKNALVIASELASRLFKHTRYEQVAGNEIDFNAEFLRWMLSDGAGALLLENQPRKTGKSLRIDWIKSFSHADVYPVCMSVGMPKDSDKSWQDFATYSEAEQAGALLLRQDVRLLENIVAVGVNGFLKLQQDKMFNVDEVDHVLCHFSSAYFKSKIVDMLSVAGVQIPEDKWYTNLYERGNTGCASIFIMLDEFLSSHSLTVGETLFCMVPESGRFNCAYMHLTVVE